MLFGMRIRMRLSMASGAMQYPRFVICYLAMLDFFKFLRHSQSMEEHATLTLDRYHHFHGHSGMCA